MQHPPLSDDEADALAELVEPYVCPIQLVKKTDTRQPPGYQFGTGWLVDRNGVESIVTCEHVAREQSNTQWLAFSCFGGEDGAVINSNFHSKCHPIDAAVAPVAKALAVMKGRRSKCVTASLLAASHSPVAGELFYTYGFPGVDAKQMFGTQIAQGMGVFLREVELEEAVFQEPQPHPTEMHICLAWSPKHAVPMLGTHGALSLPNGMSGSPLWNTRYEEIRLHGGKWSPSNARVVGMIWGHSAKACQLYATPIDVLVRELSL